MKKALKVFVFFFFILVLGSFMCTADSSFGAGRGSVVGGKSGSVESPPIENIINSGPVNGLKDHYIEVDGKKVEVGPYKKPTPEEDILLAKCKAASCGIYSIVAAADRLGLDNPSFNPILDARDSVSGNLARGILGLFSDKAKLISTPADMVRMADAAGMEVKDRIVGKSPDEMNKAIQDAWAQGDQVVYRTQKNPIDQHWSNYEGPGGEMLKQEVEQQDNGGMGKIVDAFVFTKKKTNGESKTITGNDINDYFGSESSSSDSSSSSGSDSGSSSFESSSLGGSDSGYSPSDITESPEIPANELSAFPSTPSPSAPLPGGIGPIEETPSSPDEYNANYDPCEDGNYINNLMDERDKYLGEICSTKDTIKMYERQLTSIKDISAQLNGIEKLKEAAPRKWYDLMGRLKFEWEYYQNEQTINEYKKQAQEINNQIVALGSGSDVFSLKNLGEKFNKANLEVSRCGFDWASLDCGDDLLPTITTSRDPDKEFINPKPGKA